MYMHRRRMRRIGKQLAEVLDTRMFRALGEPARTEVLKALIEHGPCDVESIAETLPQDRSVISRHLQQLEEAGILTSTRAGRRRLYAFDGPALLATFDRIHATIRQLVATCCPPGDSRT